MRVCRRFQSKLATRTSSWLRGSAMPSTRTQGRQCLASLQRKAATKWHGTAAAPLVSRLGASAMVAPALRDDHGGNVRDAVAVVRRPLRRRRLSGGVDHGGNVRDAVAAVSASCGRTGKPPQRACDDRSHRRSHVTPQHARPRPRFEPERRCPSAGRRCKSWGEQYLSQIGYETFIHMSSLLHVYIIF